MTIRNRSHQRQRVIAVVSVLCAFVAVDCHVQNSPAAEEATRQWPDSKVGELLKELEQLQNNRRTGELAWEQRIRQLILIGPDAVPDLIAALDATPSEDRLMLRSIPFVLRGIGDKRAIPALIRSIPRCYGTDGSDMGYACEDPELLKFLQEHDNSDRDRGHNYSYGRPVNEIFRTLEHWTGVNNSWNELAFVSDRTGTSRQKQLKQQLFNDHAQRWADWWQEHWQEYVNDEQYAKVDLPRFEQQKPIVEQPDLSQSLTNVSGSSNMIIQPLQHGGTTRSFYDLDTGRWAGPPERLRSLEPQQLDKAQAEILDWAQAEGFDLMGTEIEHNGQTHYVIEGIDLNAWEIPMSFWRSEQAHTMQSMISAGRPADELLAHYDIDNKSYQHDQTGLFFYITNEGTPGQLYLGVEVHDTDVAVGVPAMGNAELNPKGFWKGRRLAIAVLDAAE